MQDIKGYDRSIQELLSGSSYGIDYYQREYKWQTKQLTELINDLTGRFLEYYTPGDKAKQVSGYGHYFLGSVVVSKHDEKRHIVDGQQRLTSLTLLLIYLNNAQKLLEHSVNIESLIYDDDFGEKKFKISVPDRNDCMAALFNGEPYDADGKPESIQNLVGRFADIDDVFPDDLLNAESLPLFIYWLKDKVKLIEIIAYDDADAYTIFETMNDRGLSLSPTDMLKGYLLANIDEPEKRLEADQLIKGKLRVFSEYGKDIESDFFKSWLRARYAQKIRERKKEATPEDFDLIGTEYHRWVRDNRKIIGLETSSDFYHWIVRDFNFYAQLFCTLLDATRTRIPGLESIRYNADHGFTLQLQLLLASVTPDNGHAVALQKAAVVADYLDCLLNLRIWNFKSNDYSTMQYAIFILSREIRDMNLAALRTHLRNKLQTECSDINFDHPTSLNRSSSKTLHRQLARFIDWMEQQCGQPGHYEEYIIRSGKNAYEIEHIWSKHYEPHAHEFEQRADFDRYRNMIGSLVLLPKKINASLNDKDYDYKLQHYIKQNLFVQSLHPLCYQNNPGMKQVMQKYDLPFSEHKFFNKQDVEVRNDLCSRLAKIIWSPDRLQHPQEELEAA